MNRASFFGSSGFRTTFLFSAMFLIGVAIAGATAYSVINNELEDRHRRVLTEDFDALKATFISHGIVDLQETLAAHIEATRNLDSLFSLQDQSGKHILGNIPNVPPALPFGLVPTNALGLQADYGYFVKQDRLGGYILTVGKSAEDISEIDEIFLQGALWAGLVLVLISLGSAVWMSRRMNRRIQIIQESLEAVSDGRFETRIPMTSGGDDIDTLAIMVNSTIERLGTAVENIRQISNDISHDLKTPLNRLQIIIEEAADEHEAGHPIAAELEEARGETKRIINTFDALLRIAQIESGARRSRFNTIDVGTIMTEIVDFYRASFEDQGMELTEIASGSPEIATGDRELLAQLFANLMENALRHCPTGASVECSVRTKNGILCASVADNGPGIPEESREKVLRRLYRLETSRTTQGSGLGLAMVKAIVELHGASLILTDNNPGLCVTISFPTAGSTNANLLCGLVTVWFRSLVSHYAPLASKAKGLMPPRYEWRLRVL